MRRLPKLVMATVAVLIVFAACSPEKKHYVPSVTDGNTTPTMTTVGVSTLISDSGYTRYHLTTPVWQIFEDADEPFWRFPDGLEVEQYDLAMNPASNVVCDSAIYLSQKKLWQLDGNVVMVNTQADSFLTQQLFWDQNQRKIYTDSFIHIARSDRIIEGYGMVSDQSMVYYTVTNPTAILPSNTLPGRRDSSQRDTAAKPSPSPEPQAAAKPQKSEKPANPDVEAMKAVTGGEPASTRQPLKQLSPKKKLTKQ